MVRDAPHSDLHPAPTGSLGRSREPNARRGAGALSCPTRAPLKGRPTLERGGDRFLSAGQDSPFHPLPRPLSLPTSVSVFLHRQLPNNQPTQTANKRDRCGSFSWFSRFSTLPFHLLLTDKYSSCTTRGWGLPIGEDPWYSVSSIIQREMTTGSVARCGV